MWWWYPSVCLFVRLFGYMSPETHTCRALAWLLSFIDDGTVVTGWCRSAAAEANPNVSGKDSTSSTTSTGSEGSTSDSDGSEIEGNLDVTDDDRSPTSHDRPSGLVSLKVATSIIWRQCSLTWLTKCTSRSVAMYCCCCCYNCSFMSPLASLAW